MYCGDLLIGDHILLVDGRDEDLIELGGLSLESVRLLEDAGQSVPCLALDDYLGEYRGRLQHRVVLVVLDVHHLHEVEPHPIG